MEFKDRTQPKKKKAEAPFNNLSRDKLSASDFMSPGEDYGSGFAQKVGKDKASDVQYVPQKTRQFSVEDVHHV